MTLKRGPVSRADKLKKPLIVFLTILFVLSFFGFFGISSNFTQKAEAVSQTPLGVTVTGGDLNLKCVYKPTEVVELYYYKVTCTWNKTEGETITYIVELYDDVQHVFSEFCRKVDKNQCTGEISRFSPVKEGDSSIQRIRTEEAPPGEAEKVSETVLNVYRRMKERAEKPVISGDELEAAQNEFNAARRECTDEEGKIKREYENTIIQITALFNIVVAKAKATAEGESQGESGGDLEDFVKKDPFVQQAISDYDELVAEKTKEEEGEEEEAEGPFTGCKSNYIGRTWIGTILGLLENFPYHLICAFCLGLANVEKALWDKISEAAFEKIITVAEVADNDFVEATWNTIVGAINGFFVIAFLFAVLVTVLRLPFEVWRLQRMIPSIVLGVILINSSIWIVRTILRVMDFFSMQFSSETLSVILGGEALKIGGKTDLLEVALIVLIVGIFIIAYLYLIIMLLVRVAVLLILSAFSPVPYISYIFPIPAIQKLTSSWWEYFMSWAMMGPLVALFLYLASVAAELITPGEFGITFGRKVFQFIIFAIILFLAATWPLKLGKEVAGRVQGFIGAQAKRVGRAAKETARRAGRAQVTRLKEAAVKERRPGVLGVPGRAWGKVAAGLLTAARAPRMRREMWEKRGAAAEEEFKKAQAKGAFTRRFLKAPLTKDEIDEKAKSIKDFSKDALREALLDEDLSRRGDLNRQAAKKFLEDVVKGKYGSKKKEELTPFINELKRMGYDIEKGTIKGEKINVRKLAQQVRKIPKTIEEAIMRDLSLLEKMSAAETNKLNAGKIKLEGAKKLRDLRTSIEGDLRKDVKKAVGTADIDVEGAISSIISGDEEKLNGIIGASGISPGSPGEGRLKSLLKANIGKFTPEQARAYNNAGIILKNRKGQIRAQIARRIKDDLSNPTLMGRYKGDVKQYQRDLSRSMQAIEKAATDAEVLEKAAEEYFTEYKDKEPSPDLTAEIKEKAKVMQEISTMAVSANREARARFARLAGRKK